MDTVAVIMVFMGLLELFIAAALGLTMVTLINLKEDVASIKTAIASDDDAGRRQRMAADRFHEEINERVKALELGVVACDGCAKVFRPKES